MTYLVDRHFFFFPSNHPEGIVFFPTPAYQTIFPLLFFLFVYLLPWSLRTVMSTTAGLFFPTQKEHSVRATQTLHKASSIFAAFQTKPWRITAEAKSMNEALQECKKYRVTGSSRTCFPPELLRLRKTTKLSRKSKIWTQKISNKDKSNTSLFYKYFFFVKRQTFIETYKKYSSEKQMRLRKITKYRLF